jgi:iron(III) transport system permease protein
MQLSLPKRSPVIQWSGALTAIFLVAFPLLPLAYQSFVDRPIYETGVQFTLNNYLNLFTNPLFHQTVINSFLLIVFGGTFSFGRFLFQRSSWFLAISSCTAPKE